MSGIYVCCIFFKYKYKIIHRQASTNNHHLLIIIKKDILTLLGIFSLPNDFYNSVPRIV